VSGLRTHTVIFGMSLEDENIHAPDEFFRLSSFERGEQAWPLLLQRLGEHQPVDAGGDAPPRYDRRARPRRMRTFAGASGSVSHFVGVGGAAGLGVPVGAVV
jgi:hypothetical protein